MPFTEVQTQTIQTVIRDTADAFHVRATLADGNEIAVPSAYQLAEPGFRPSDNAAKYSPSDLQDAFNNVVSLAAATGVDLGLTGNRAVTKLMVQMGLGIDCSNFAFRVFSDIHQQLGLGDYSESVFRSTEDVRKAHETKESWAPKTPTGEKRDLTADEKRTLDENTHVSAKWLEEVFGKSPVYIIGTKHICAPEAAVSVSSHEVQAGDILVFNKVHAATPTHLAVVDDVVLEAPGSKRVTFWHSWHTRDFDSGLRRDRVRTIDGELTDWSHRGLTNPDRYAGHEFVRSIGLDSLG